MSENKDAFYREEFEKYYFEDYRISYSESDKLHLETYLAGRRKGKEELLAETRKIMNAEECVCEPMPSINECPFCLHKEVFKQSDENESLKKEIEELNLNYNKIHSFCLDYQMYIHSLLASHGIFQSFQHIRKNAYSQRIERGEAPIWGDPSYTNKGIERLDNYEDIIESKDKEIKILREALGFYANPEKHESEWLEDYSYYDPSPPLRRTVNAHGKKARQALAEIDKIKGV